MTGPRPSDPRGAWSLVVGSLSCLVGGILWPGVAESLLRVLLASLAVGWGAARAWGMGLPATPMHKVFSPFDGVLADAPPPTTPDVVERRARTVAAADHAAGAGRPIPWPVARTLYHETARRLERGRRLRMDDPADQARVRETVSESTWILLGSEGGGRSTRADGFRESAIPISRLDDILDDLERL